MKSSRSRSDPQKSLVGFTVGEIPYAIEIGRVIQIVNPLRMSPLPHLPEAVVGVADYRGDVLPVIDLRLRFGLSASTVTRRTKWIVVEIARQPAALVVDGVSEVFGTAGAELRPAPGLGGDDRRGILGVTTHNGVLTFVLDLQRLRAVVDAFEGAGVRAAPHREESASGRPLEAPSIGARALAGGQGGAAGAGAGAGSALAGQGAALSREAGGKT
jgi:purine-binding chemotaxis protein CheW